MRTLWARLTPRGNRWSVLPTDVSDVNFEIRGVLPNRNHTWWLQLHWASSWTVAHQAAHRFVREAIWARTGLRCRVVLQLPPARGEVECRMEGREARPADRGSAASRPSGQSRGSSKKRRSQGLARTDADNAIPGARVPLAEQVTVCVSRWQRQLPEHGAVSLAEMHR